MSSNLLKSFNISHPREKNTKSIWVQIFNYWWDFKFSSIIRIIQQVYEIKLQHSLQLKFIFFVSLMIKIENFVISQCWKYQWKLKQIIYFLLRLTCKFVIWISLLFQFESNQAHKGSKKIFFGWKSLNLITKWNESSSDWSEWAWNICKIFRKIFFIFHLLRLIFQH